MRSQAVDHPPTGRAKGGDAWGISLVLLALTAACTGVESTPRRASEPGVRPPVSKGTLTIAWAREPENLNPKFLGSAGTGEASWVFTSFLTYRDFYGTPHPMLAERIPTRENGDWVVNADGTMVTTYRLREHSLWHDGTPLTAHDFAFAHRVYMDPDVASTGREPERLIASIRAPDDRTLVIVWAEPYLYANVLSRERLPPLPRSLLEDKYRASRATFAGGEEWTSAYVGNGPFRVEQWEPGTRIIAKAFADWVLGPPKIETLDIRFLSDSNAILANVLAGEVDFTTSPAIRVTEGVVARDRWAADGRGYLKTWESRLRYVEFQYREVPNWQRAVTDVRVRRAFSQAIDRHALAIAMTEGLGGAADAFALPTDPMFPDVSAAITKYVFDPSRAVGLLAEAGWQPQPSRLLANAMGDTLDVEINSGSSEPQQATIIAGDWNGIGINASVYVLPLARQRDREFRASFPATHMGERTVWIDDFPLISSRIPTAESGFVELNRGSFSDREVDRLHNLAITALDESVRHHATVALHQRLSDLAAYVPLYYGVEVLLASSRLRGPVGNYGPQPGVTWNVFEWEVH